MRKIADNIKGYLFDVFLIVVSLYAIVLLFLALWPSDPIRVDSISLNKTTVEQGKEICFKFEGEKYHPIPVAATIELVNGESVALMNYTSNNPVGGPFKWRCFSIPYHVPPGKWQLRWTGRYQMNPLRHVIKTKDSGWFEVTEGWVNGLQGARGIQGEKGARGIQGEKGDKGGVSLFGKGR
jgi:hypothetical protein